MYGLESSEVFARVVFCRECKKKVEDCEHFVYPIKGKRVPVFDPKIECLAYGHEQRILEIAFKGGPSLASCLRSRREFTANCVIPPFPFLKFIARGCALVKAM